MAKRYIGDATVDVRYVGESGGRPQYAGRITLPGGRKWPFKDLGGPMSGGGAVDSPTTLSKMAASAVSFASYYTTHNRGDDVPDWAPPEDLADDIESATSWAQSDNGEFEVHARRPKSGGGAVPTPTWPSLPPGTSRG
jgi:hypothetical protein